MAIRLIKKYREVQTALEDNQRMISALKARQQRLNEKLITATMARRFEEGGATRRSPSWCINGNGKLERVH